MRTTATPDYWFKRGDTYSPLEAILKDGDGKPASIAGATVTFSMRAIGADTNKVNAAVAVNLDDGTAANKGRVRYVWLPSDVDQAGDFYGEFTATFAGAAETFPRGVKEYLLIRGQARL